MALYEVKEERCRLICDEKDKEKVLEHIKKHKFLHVVGSYVKKTRSINWLHIIVDSDRTDLDRVFVSKFNREIGDCLAVFEEYDPMFD